MNEVVIARSELDALLRRLDELESREAIADLVHAYTELVRDRRESEVVGLMVDDAWIELRHGNALEPGSDEPNDRFEGKQEILGSFGRVAGQNAVVVPMIHNLRIVLDGDSASSRCIMASSMRPHGFQFIGEYRDTYRREHGRWLFASRTFIGFGDMAGKTAHEVHADWQDIKVSAETS